MVRQFSIGLSSKTPTSAFYKKHTALKRLKINGKQWPGNIYFDLIALQCIFYYTILVSVTMFCHQIKNKLFCPQNTLTIPRSLGRKSFLHGRLVTNG